MKKTYLSPNTKLLLIATHKMIAASNPTGFKGETDDNDPISPDDMLSRRRSQWDEDEEEEEF